MYAIRRFKLVEKLPGRPASASSGVIETLTCGFIRVGAGGNVKQKLVGGRILHHAAAFPFTVSTTGVWCSGAAS